MESGIIKSDSFYAQGESNKVSAIKIDFDQLISYILQKDTGGNTNLISLTTKQLKELYKKLGKIIEEHKL